MPFTDAIDRTGRDRHAGGMDTKRFRRLGNSLPRMLGWDNADWTDVHYLPRSEPLATPMPIGAVASVALAAVGVAAGSIARQRGRQAGPVKVDTVASGLAMCANDYLLLDGKPPGSWPELTRFYRAADGWVFLHGGFPPQAARLAESLGAANNRESVTARVAELPAQEVEDRCLATNTCGRRLRTLEEWLEHPAAKSIADQPALSFETIGEGDPHPWQTAETPLTGIRVLDLSRVLAGPTIGRTLAEHGAEVLRVAGPEVPFIEALVIDTGFGKRSAHINLATDDGRAQMRALVRDADVFIDGYRPGALAGHGLDPETLFDLNPNLVHLTLSAFGETGPWGGSRGYDSLVQAAVGLAGGDPPRRLPCQPLDYLAGYLGAFAIMRALDVRAGTGRGARIALSLAGMAHWLREMTAQIDPIPDPPEHNPRSKEIASELTQLDTVFGRVTTLRPALDVPWRNRVWAPSVRLGTHAPQWSDA